MASNTPLGISLGIDFQKLDADLSRVADKIERVGTNTSIKLGTASGLAGKGDLGTDAMAGQVSQIGIALSQGMASGIRASSAALLSFGARINAVLDRMSGAMIEMFNRIDVAMKGHRWTNLLTGLSNSLGNFAAGGKALTPLEKAMGGAFGGIAKKASQVFNAMAVNLGETMTKAMNKTAVSMSSAMKGAATEIKNAMTEAMAAIDRSMKKLSAHISVDMIAAINELSAKLKNLRVSAEGAAGTLHGAGPGRPYMREIAPPQRAKPIIDVEAKIKPPSQAAVDRLAKSVNMKVFSNKELFTPDKPKPQKVDFSGAMPKPQMFQEFKSIIKDTVAGIKNIPVAFQAAASSGNQYAIAASTALTVLLKIDRVAASTASVIVRVGAGFAAMGLASVAAIGKTISFFSTMGSIGKHSFRDLQESHGIFMGSVLGGVKVLHMLYRGLVDIVTLRAFRRVGDDATQAKGAMGALTGSVGKLLGSVGRLGVELAAAFGILGLAYKVAEFFKGGVKAAAELNAEVTRSKVVFGDSFSQVSEQVEKNAKAFNISKGAQMELASSFGSMAQGAGVSEAKSADLANELTSLAIDATGVGISFTEASEAMKTGLSGRAISLKQLAVNIDENTTKAYAWKTGIASVGQELTAQQTIMARVGQITRGLSYLQGSLAAGANSAAVQFQRAGGGIAIFAEKIGELLLPAVNSATKGFNALLGGVLNLAETAGPTLQSWANDSSAVVDTFIAKTQEFGPTILANLTWAWAEAKKGPLGFVIEGTEVVINFARAIPEAIGIAIRNAGTLWEIAKIEVGAFVENSIRRVQTFGQNFGVIFDWIKRNWFNMLMDMGFMIATFFKNLMKNAGDIGEVLVRKMMGEDVTFKFTGLLDGFKATTEKLPELIKPDLVDVGEQVKKLYDKIGQNELKRSKPKPDAEGGPMGPKMKPIEGDKSKEYKLGGALEAGSKEAISAISKGQSGRSSTTDAVKQGVAVQKDIHKAINQQTEVIKTKAFAPALSIK